MILALIISLGLGFFPMVLFSLAVIAFDRFEKEPPMLMIGVFLWGMIIAAGVAYIFNTLFSLSMFALTGSEEYSIIMTVILSAPFIEETAKGLAVLGIYFFFRKEFDSVLDGIIYASLVGFGFAAAENINYIISGYGAGGYAGLFVIAAGRLLLIPFVHALFTSMTGIGLAVSRLGKGAITWIAPVLGYFAAMFFHALHNGLYSSGIGGLQIISFLLDWTGFISMMALVIYLIIFESNIMRRYLQEEVSLGNMTMDQWKNASSVMWQVTSRFHSGNNAAAFYDACGELAFRKYQIEKTGEVSDICALRNKISGLTKSVR